MIAAIKLGKVIVTIAINSSKNNLPFCEPLVNSSSHFPYQRLIIPIMNSSVLMETLTKLQLHSCDNKRHNLLIFLCNNRWHVECPSDERSRWISGKIRCCWRNKFCGTVLSFGSWAMIYTTEKCIDIWLRWCLTYTYDANIPLFLEKCNMKSKKIRYLLVSYDARYVYDVRYSVHKTNEFFLSRHWEMNAVRSCWASWELLILQTNLKIILSSKK